MTIGSPSDHNGSELTGMMDEAIPINRYTIIGYFNPGTTSSGDIAVESSTGRIDILFSERGGQQHYAEFWFSTKENQYRSLTKRGEYREVINWYAVHPDSQHSLYTQILQSGRAAARFSTQRTFFRLEYKFGEL